MFTERENENTVLFIRPIFHKLYPLLRMTYQFIPIFLVEFNLILVLYNISKTQIFGGPYFHSWGRYDTFNMFHVFA